MTRGTVRSQISPDLLGWSIGPGVRHAHPDPKHGFAQNRNAWLGLHLIHEHDYRPWLTLPANRKLHRSLHANWQIEQGTVWRPKRNTA